VAPGGPPGPGAPPVTGEHASPAAAQQSSSGWGQQPPSQQSSSAWTGSGTTPTGSGYSGTAAPTQQFGTGSAAGAHSPSRGYGSEYPTQQYGAGQSPTSGFGAAPGSSQSGYGGQQSQQYGGQGAYGTAQAPSAYSPQGGPQGQPQYGGQTGYGAASQQGGYPGQQGPSQGYGGYPTTAPTKKRNTALIVTIVGVVVALGIAAVLYFTLSKTVLDQERVQADVAAQFEDQEGVGIDLTCPADMEVEVSSTYECTGTTGDSEEVTLVIEITDEDGNYTWQEQQ